MTDADVAAYHAHFPRQEGTITGEWTGRYLFDPWTPPLLKRAAPDAKLLVMLSDPIERYRATFADRLAKRAGDETIYMADVVDRRSFAAQLARLHRFFDPERVLVLQFERCRRDPAGQYRRTLEFLGVRDTAFRPRRLQRKASIPLAIAARLGLPRKLIERVVGPPGRRGRPRRSGPISRLRSTPRSTRRSRSSASSCRISTSRSGRTSRIEPPPPRPRRTPRSPRPQG